MGRYEVTPVQMSLVLRVWMFSLYSAEEVKEEKLKPKAPLTWQSIRPGERMRFWRSMVTSGTRVEEEDSRILPVWEEMKRSDETRESLMTRRQFVSLVMLVPLP